MGLKVPCTQDGSAAGRFVMSDKIEFLAEVVKLQTVADGGIRLTLDLPEQARKIMEPLTECQQNGIVLKIRAEKA